MEAQDKSEERPVYEKNRMYFDFGYSATEFQKTNSEANIASLAGISYFIQQNRTQNNSSISRSDFNTLGNVYFAQTSKPAKGDSNNYRFSIEYALSKYFGIGGSLNSSQIQFENLPSITQKTSFNNFFFFNSLFFTDVNQQTRDSWSILALADLKQSIEIKNLQQTIADFEIAFHLPLEGIPLDPYTKLGVGVNLFPIKDIGGVTKNAVTVGIRYAMYEQVNLSLEYYISRYEYSIQENISRLQEIGARILLGTSMGPP